MNGNEQVKQGFIGYEYKSITVKHSMADLYADCMPSFGWELEKTSQSLTPTSIVMKFKRERKLVNKAELTRLQREFESRSGDIGKLETSKVSRASTAAYIIGVIGTAFMAGSVFAVTAVTPNIPLCIILGIPGLVGWILPYFVYRRMSERQTDKVTPLIDEQYDAVYAACEKASALLYK